MNWQNDAENSLDNGYVAPRVTQLKLDPGGNYVSPAWAMKDKPLLSGPGSPGILGGSPPVD